MSRKTNTCGYNKPNSRARAMASVRLCTWSLSKILRLCPLTVSRARKSRSPISRFESPWVISFRISNSRGSRAQAFGLRIIDFRLWHGRRLCKSSQEFIHVTEQFMIRHEAAFHPHSKSKISNRIGSPSSTKIRMKPPGSASARASPSNCTALSFSPLARRATA